MKFHNTESYKYEVAEDFAVRIPELDGVAITTPHFSISQQSLTVKAGYSWDGASGPTWDTPDTMTPSLVHDVLYQCIREKLLPQDFRFDADLILYRLMRERTHTLFGHCRAFYFFVGVRLFGWLATKPLPVEPQDKTIEVV